MYRFKYYDTVGRERITSVVSARISIFKEDGKEGRVIIFQTLEQLITGSPSRCICYSDNAGINLYNAIKNGYIELGRHESVRILSIKDIENKEVI